MSSCTLRIELDETSPVAAGTTLRGTVHVEVNAPVKCNALSVELRWFVNGSSRRDPERCHTVVPFEGHWPPGIHAVPFSIDVPSAPLTVHSKAVRLEWDLTARADIPWSIDPSAVQAIEVVRDPARPRQRCDVGVPPVSVIPRVAMNWMLGVMAIGMGGMATYVTGLLASYGFTVVGFFIPIGIFIVGVGVWVIWSQIQEQRLRALLRTLAVQVPPGPHWPGDTVEATVSVAADDRIELLDVSLTLRRKAWVVVRDHQNKSRRTASWDDAETRMVWSDLVLAGGRTESKTVPLTLPLDATPNTCFAGVGARWCLDLEVTLRGVKQPIRHEVNVLVA